MKKNDDLLKAKKFLKILKKNIKKNNKFIHLHQPCLFNNTYSFLKDCVKNNFISSEGPHSKKFLKEIKKTTKTKYSVLTCNGTSALHAALISLGIKKNDEILMPSLNYIASGYAALYCGAIPHFIEVSEDSMCVDDEKLEKYLKHNTFIKNNLLRNKKTGRTIKALICLHIFGHSAKIDKIKKICKKYKILLIEDAAEALGSLYKNKHLGTFGDVGILSFNGNKIISTGAGGAVLTQNKKYYFELKCIIENAKVPHPYYYNYSKLGYNYRLPNINSAIGLSQIQKIKKILKNKRILYKFYKDIFSNLNFLDVFKEPENSKSNYWLQTVLLKKPNLSLRNKILKITNKNGISTRPAWTLLHKIKFLKKSPKMKLSTSINLEKRIINIPSSPDIIKFL